MIFTTWWVQLIKLFIANLHSSSCKKIVFLLLHMSIKKYTDFKPVELIGNKCTNNTKNFCKLVIRRGQTTILHPFFAYNFFVFFAFFSTVPKSAQNNELFWNQNSNFIKKQFLGHISTFLGTLKPNSQETTQNFEKRFLQKCSYGTVHFFSSVWSEFIHSWSSSRGLN